MRFFTYTLDLRNTFLSFILWPRPSYTLEMKEHLFLLKLCGCTFGKFFTFWSKSFFLYQPWVLIFATRDNSFSVTFLFKQKWKNSNSSFFKFFLFFQKKNSFFSALLRFIFFFCFLPWWVTFDLLSDERSASLILINRFYDTLVVEWLRN